MRSALLLLATLALAACANGPPQGSPAGLTATSDAPAANPVGPLPSQPSSGVEMRKPADEE